MGNYFEKFLETDDPLSAASGRAAAERSGDQRFAPPAPTAPAGNYFSQFGNADRTEDPARIATTIPQGINQGLYKGAMALPDLSGIIAQRLGLANGPLPSEAVQEAGGKVRDQAGVTYSPNIIPETTGERIGLQVGDAVGQVASTAIPASIVTRAAAPTVRGMRVAAPTYGQTVAETLAAQPGMQVAANSAGNLTTEFTGNPYLGLGAAFATPAAANAALRIPFSAPARNTAEAERRALLAEANHEGVLPSFGTIQNSTFAKMFESTLDKLPFMGGRSAALNEGNKTAFNRAAFNTIPEVTGEGIDAATRGNLDMVRGRIGRTFNQLQNNTTVNVDQRFGHDIAAARAGFSRQLQDQMPANILNKLDEFEAAARTHNQPGFTGVTLDGETYKNIRSKLSAQLDGASGVDRQTIGRMIDALDGAVERSLPRDMVHAWQDARTSWRRFMMINDATGARHNAQTDVGHIPPGSLAARTGNDRRMERLAAVGTSFVGDKTPDSGTASRSLIQNTLGLGAGAGAGSQFPWTTAALAGGAYLTNAALNNPYTRAALVNRLQRSREGVVNRGLVATLAAQQAAGEER